MSLGLEALDEFDDLAPLLQPFSDCTVRAVLRPTETYAELERMLWHPVSLSDEKVARARAADVLLEMGRKYSFAPTDSAIIDLEIDHLLAGDVPAYYTTPAKGSLAISDALTWLPERNLIKDSLDNWRAADRNAERSFIRGALVSAYINDGYLRPITSLWVGRRTIDKDARRRAHAARIVRDLIADAIRGGDQTATWIAPILSPSGWAVQPLAADLYTGLSGVALLLTAYDQEVRAARADEIEEVPGLLHDALKSLDCFEDVLAREYWRRERVRPPVAGGFAGLGSQIWTRLALAQLTQDERHRRRAEKLAELAAWSLSGAKDNDLLHGRAGMLVGLLRLWQTSGAPEHLSMAEACGREILANAARTNETMFWSNADDDSKPLGGFAHGATGIGWALRQLARAAGDDVYEEAAVAAFSYERTLWDPEERNWRDLRGLPGVTVSTAWCHGAPGIGMAHLSIDPALESTGTEEIVRNAMEATRQTGFGWNHCLCHGDFGNWELFKMAAKSGCIIPAFAIDDLETHLLASLDEHGPVCGVSSLGRTPTFFTGNVGIAYQLLRMHPEAVLPSPLTAGQ